MSDELVSVEGTGETVREARWSALRELERRVPSLDPEAVEVTVLSEGERGLLGVGYTPARVVATVRVSLGPSDDEGAERARTFVERVAWALGADVAVSARRSGDTVTVTCAGRDLGLLIGRHGQTIDAIQYLANAMARAEGDEETVIVDAAGYRARRKAALEATARRAAERALATGRRVALEPMTAVERKIVHEALKDDPELETVSEGAEPSRFVVIRPRRLTG